MKSLVSAVFTATLSVSMLVSAAPTARPSSQDTEPSLLSGVGDTVKDTKGSVDGVVASTLAGATGVLEGFCSADYKCEINVTGPITSLLVDGGNYTDQASVSGWCDKGHCYGASKANLVLPNVLPFDITCDDSTPNGECKGHLAGAAKAVFDNGNELELWGWLTPSGYCKNGVCVASLDALGDPAYR
ncbi:hypothetical protein GTA08_BOTSDO09536 [Botryosphaeria dothidea]|uniref:Uncharacterized protein n=1 Tax=Botryosphaeria dothidea TaxID=55169 RepID=A0A8H4IM23_9PEZI|nr:hypothetical protein GTA08_BOTSDO09536 [Botryosphaeria dothidea]